jgi:hypothetical protein
MACATPAQAAADGVPPDEVEVLDVSISPDGCHAVVLLAVGRPPAAEILESLCIRANGGWEEHDTECGPGWTWIEGFGGAGVHTAWTHELASSSGFAAVEWNAPPPSPPPAGRPNGGRW